MPVQALIVVPFVPLAKLAAHEEQFFARLSVHPCVKHSEVGKLLPFITRHFCNERAFAMHYLIVTQHQNEVLLKCVEQREGDVAVVKPPEDRIETHVLEEVMHPAHVPFETEAEAAQISRTRHARPGG